MEILPSPFLADQEHRADYPRHRAQHSTDQQNKFIAGSFFSPSRIYSEENSDTGEIQKHYLVGGTSTMALRQ